MLLAVFVAVLAVALGAALTVVSGTRPQVVGPLRTFAATAAAGVVLSHLLPEALEGAGIAGALAFGIGLVAPLALHALTERWAENQRLRKRPDIALDAAFVGLLVHHVGDGIGIGAYAALPGGVFSHLDVILALIAHTVPLVAVVTLAYRARSMTVALGRAAALAVASAAGVGISFAVPEASLGPATPWIGAVAGGVLIHIVTHDWLEDLPASGASRAFDFIAAALGLAMVLLGAEHAGHTGHAGHIGAEEAELLQPLVRVAKQGAPFILVALSLSSALRERVSGELDKLPKSMVVVLLRRLSFALGVEGLALGLAFYGIAWTLLGFAATTLVPLVASGVALLAVAIAGDAAAARADAGMQAAAAFVRTARASEARYARHLRHFDRATASWVLAVTLAAIIELALPADALLGSVGGPGELASAALAGAVLGAGGGSVAALHALTAKGLSTGAALTFAAVSSALGLSSLRGLHRMIGWRGTVPVVIWLVCLTSVLGIALNQVAPIPRPLRFPPLVETISLWLLSAAILSRAFYAGVRRWSAGWFDDGRDAAHRHTHAEPHHHGHGFHSSESANGKAATTRSPAASGPSADA